MSADISQIADFVNRFLNQPGDAARAVERTKMTPIAPPFGPFRRMI
jgi:hypothetical protein